LAVAAAGLPRTRPPLVVAVAAAAAAAATAAAATSSYEKTLGRRVIPHSAGGAHCSAGYLPFWGPKAPAFMHREEWPAAVAGCARLCETGVGAPCQLQRVSGVPCSSVPTGTSTNVPWTRCSCAQPEQHSAPLWG